MRALALDLPGVLKFELETWRDARGLFLETWNQREFAKCGLDAHFVQDNLSISNQWTLRGLHYQIEQPQGKLIRVLAGEIFDVVTDLRRSSPTFGRSVGVHLSARDHQLLWVPPGLAHGFLALAQDTHVAYKVTEYWAPQFERTLLWSDPDLRIDWPIPRGIAPIVSGKDAAGSPLSTCVDFA